MIWWLKVRRVHPLLTLGMVAFAVATFAVQDTAIVLPALSLSIGNVTQLAFFTPVIVVAVLAQVLDNRLLSAEASGIRKVRWLDASLIAVTVCFSLALAAVGGWVTGSEAVVSSGRNVCVLTGLMLCARAFVRRSGIVIPLAWIFVVIFFGRKTGTSYYEWAVTAQPADDLLSAACAAAAIAIGLVLTHHFGNRL